MSDARARGTNPRFPWKPSAAMLTYRLKSTNVFPGTTTTNTGNDPAAPDASTTGDHRRIFANHGAPTGRQSADLAHVSCSGVAADN